MNRLSNILQKLAILGTMFLVGVSPSVYAIEEYETTEIEYSAPAESLNPIEPDNVTENTPIENPAPEPEPGSDSATEPDTTPESLELTEPSEAPTPNPTPIIDAKLIDSDDYYRLSEDVVAGLSLKSEKFYLYDLSDGREFYARGADDQVAVASLTKMMTALVFLENHPDIAELNQTITITAEMLVLHEAYTNMGLTEGQVITVRDALYGLMLPSAADAATALSFYDAGSVEAFVEKMNQKATSMGLTNTHFSNPYGMDEVDTIEIYPNSANPANYSTARECEKILAEGLKNATFREIFESFSYDTSYGATIVKSATTYIDRLAGLKTGYTAEAKRCLASNAIIDGKEFLLINLGAENIPDHLTDATKLYNLVDDTFDAKTIASAGTKVTDLPIKWGQEDTYEIKLTTDLARYLRRDEPEDFALEFQGISEITSHQKLGDEIGKVVIKQANMAISEVPVNLDRELSFINYPLYIVLGFIVILIIFRPKRRR